MDASEQEPPERGASASEWRVFEEHVAALLATYEDAEVLHDHSVVGRQSGVTRQVDVWVTGTVAGHRVTLAIECKAFTDRKVGIGVVDAFCGFLEDVGADKGVLYTSSLFTSGARQRAEGHGHILLIDEEHIPTEEETRALLEPDWCPNCEWGDVGYKPCPGGEYGACGRCGASYLRCSQCGYENDFDHGDIECIGCGAQWLVEWDPRDLETVTQTRLPNTE